MPKREEDLYPEIESWLETYLTEKYKGYKVTTTHKTSRHTLETYLRSLGITIEEAIGIAIKVDIVGVLQRDKIIKLVFIEVKDKALNLKDLGQLWGYSQLLNPIESFLISSAGLGSLERVLKVFKREDLLKYGQKHSRMMKVCSWNVRAKTVDYSSMIPKL